MSCESYTSLDTNHLDELSTSSTLKHASTIESPVMHGPSLDLPMTVGSSHRPNEYNTLSVSEVPEVLSVLGGVARGDEYLEKPPPCIQTGTSPPDPRLDGMSLLIAVAGGDQTEVKTLLDHGAEINQCHSTSGDYALQIAATKGDLGMVDTLLSHGAVTYKCHPATGDFIVRSAIIGGNAAIVTRLSENGSSPINVDSELNALSFAIELNKESIVDLFLDAGAAKQGVDQSQLTAALHQAILFQHRNIITNVLNRGVLPDEVAVHLAIGTGDLDILNLLAGDDWQTTNPSFGGKTLLHIAVGCGDINIIRALVEAGVDIRKA